MHPLVGALEPFAKTLGPTLAPQAFARGLAVTTPTGEQRPIPITLSPVVLDASTLQHRARLATHLSSAAFKMAKAMLSGQSREVLISALSPLERKMAEKTFAQIERLATTRVDCFVSSGKPWALEVNATIPAMQGYSDIAAESFIECVGSFAGLSQVRIQSLQQQNGSNARALFDALNAGYGLQREGVPRRIGILCRRNDAQISELRFLARRFSNWGTSTDLIYPDEFELTQDGASSNGQRYDLIYRHLFVRRLEETPAPAVLDLLERTDGPTVVLNPPASQIEVKTTFAFLSQASCDSKLAKQAGLSPPELDAISEAVPWTRLLRTGPNTDAEGRRIEDLVDYVSREPHRFVLKRAWDYGGRTVFVGSSNGEPGFAERVRATYGQDLSWAQLCARAAKDAAGGGFVVQQLIRAEPERHLLCSVDGLVETELFVDFSAYGSVGVDPLPTWGGVCRGSSSRIVNIVGGGGVLPLLTEDVANELAQALSLKKAAK